MTKKIHTALLIFLLALSLGIIPYANMQSQNLRVTPVKMSVNGAPGDYLDTFCDIENLTPGNLSVHIVRKTPTMPDGWLASFCLVNCYAPDAFDIIEVLEPGQKASFHLTWTTAPATPGEAALEYQFSDAANPSESYTMNFDASTMSLGVAERPAISRSTALSQNYPNPFSLTQAANGVTIGFSTAKNGLATVKIFNLVGRELATIMNAVLPAGVHTAWWSGLDYQRNAVPPGIYIYKLISGGSSLSRRMLVVR